MDHALVSPRPSKAVLRFVIAALIALFVVSFLGDLLTTTWADRRPLALIALNSRSRILVLTTNQLDPFSYYVVATLRLLISDPLYFMLGHWYGDSAIAWVQRRQERQGAMLRQFERWFGAASYVLVFVAPGPFICLLAGAARMRVSTFVALNIAGTLVRLYAIRVFGRVFEAPIDDVLGFFQQFRWPLLVLSAVFVGWTVARQVRSGGGEIEVIRELEEELEELSVDDVDEADEVDEDER